jgi:diaminopimelate epimerase
LLANQVKVSLKGGDCVIKIAKNKTILIGPATTVFEGQIII